MQRNHYFCQLEAVLLFAKLHENWFLNVISIHSLEKIPKPSIWGRFWSSFWVVLASSMGAAKCICEFFLFCWDASVVSSHKWRVLRAQMACQNCLRSFFCVRSVGVLGTIN